VSSVTTMHNMFYGAACFQGEPSSWWSSNTDNKGNWLDYAGTTSSDQCPAADGHDHEHPRYVLQALRKELQELREELADVSALASTNAELLARAPNAGVAETGETGEGEQKTGEGGGGEM